MRDFTSKKPILCIGDLIADILIPYGETKKYNADLLANSAAGIDPPAPKMDPGGTSGNTAAGIVALSGSAFIASRVGTGVVGTFLEDDMRKLGAELTYLIKDTKRDSMACLAVVDDDRVFYNFQTEPTAHEFYSKDDLPTDFIQFDIMHTSGACFFAPGMADTLVYFMEECKKNSVLISFDLNVHCEMSGLDTRRAELFKRAIAAADIVLGSAYDEICVVTDTTDPDIGSQRIADMGKVVVCRDGANPVKIYTKEEVIHVPAYPTKKIDANGAGDTFDAGFLVGVTSGMSLLDAGKLGSICGAYCVSKSGPRNCPDLKTALRLINKE